MFNVGERIKQLRKDQNINGRTLAKLVNLDPSQISKIEKGTTNPSLSSLFEICKVLNITPAELFSNEEKEISPEIRELLNTTESFTKKQLKLLNEFLKSLNNDPSHNRED